MIRALCLFLFLISTPLSASPKYSVSICAIFRDEARFLKEWIEYNRMIGVEHFYLFNHLSKDNYYEVLEPYINAGIVDLTEWNYEPTSHQDWIENIQCGAYNKTLEEFGHENTWIAFIDTDEFILLKKEKLLPSFLSHYEEYGAVVVNWQVFGTAGIEKIPETETLIGTLTLKAPFKHNYHRVIKSIAQPKAVEKFMSAHYPIFRPPYYPVNEKKRKTPLGGTTRKVCIDTICINHYINRDEVFYYTVKIPRRKDRSPVPPEPDPLYNCVEDFTMLKFVPELKKRVFCEKILPNPYSNQ